MRMMEMVMNTVQHLLVVQNLMFKISTQLGVITTVIWGQDTPYMLYIVMVQENLLNLF